MLSVVRALVVGRLYLHFFQGTGIDVLLAMASGSSSDSGSLAQSDVHSSSAAASADVLPHDQAAKAKPKKHRFSVADDVAILREIPGHSRSFKYGSKA